MNKIKYIIVLLMILLVTSCDSSSPTSDGDGGGEVIVELPYDIGETLMTEHLDMGFSICYGSDNDSLRFSDFTGKVIILNLAASW